jgi:hypothetical protein
MLQRADIAALLSSLFPDLFHDTLDIYIAHHTPDVL